MPIFYHPLFSIFVDCSDARNEDVADLVDSLAQQTYQNFEVIIAGQCAIREAFASLIDNRGFFVEPNSDLSSILGDAEQGSYRGEFSIVLRPSDRLFPDALGRIVDAIGLQSADQTSLIVIFDHLVGRESRRRHLPGWDPDLYEHVDYIQNACCLSREFLRTLSSRRPYTSLREWLLCSSEMQVEVLHVRGSIAHLSYSEPSPGEVQRKLVGMPTLSIVIPSRNGLELLSKCLNFLNNLSLPFELILVDNASDDEAVLSLYEDLKCRYDISVVPFERSFNYSSMINLGAVKAKNEVLLLLNNDVFITEPGTVELAVDYAMRPAVGVVGALLYYPDGSVQHAGMVLSKPSEEDFDTSHVLRLSTGDEGDFIGALTAPRNWQCVTGAFQIVRKSVFEAAGGYDEVNFPTEFNDVDFCLRIRALDLRVVCLPLKGVIHAESSTRSKQNAALAGRLLDDAYHVMRERWGTAYERDPFLNPGTSPGVSAVEGKSTLVGSLSIHAESIFKGLRARLRGLREEASQDRVKSIAKIRSRMPRRFKEGICLVGPFGSSDALGAQSRRLFTSCDGARIHLSVIDTELQSDTRLGVLPEAYLPISDRKISICLSRPSDLAKALPFMGEGRVRVAYPYLFEPSAASQVSSESLRGYDEIWAPSSFAADTIRARLGRQVSIVPLPLISDVDPALTANGSDQLRFVVCFDSEFYDQQNPIGAIRAFKTAFPVTRDVRLEVICRGGPSSKLQTSLRQAVEDDRRIFMTSVLVHEARTAFYRAAGQVLISLHRADVPPFDIADSLSHNMVVLATDWGHSTDLLTPSTGFPISFARNPAGVPDEISGANACVEPDLDHAVSELRAILQNFPSAHLRALAGGDVVMREYSQLAVGKNLRRVLNETNSRYSLVS